MSDIEFNGIKTKLVQGCEGFWELIVADPEQARLMVMSMEQDGIKCHYELSDEKYEEFVIASISRYWRNGKWKILDWRLSSEEEMPSPYLDKGKIVSAPLILRHLENPGCQKFLEGIYELEIEEEIVDIAGLDYKFASWPNYRNCHLDLERMSKNGKDLSYQWKYSEAMAYMKMVKEYWANFNGESLLLTKIENPLEQDKLVRTMMKIFDANKE